MQNTATKLASSLFFWNILETVGFSCVANILLTKQVSYIPVFWSLVAVPSQQVAAIKKPFVLRLIPTVISSALSTNVFYKIGALGARPDIGLGEGKSDDKN